MSYQICQLGHSLSVQRVSLPGRGPAFADVLSEEQIQNAFEEENALGQEEGDVYTPPITPWAWLSQAMHTSTAGPAPRPSHASSCCASSWAPPSPDTGDYRRTHETAGGGAASPRRIRWPTNWSARSGRLALVPAATSRSSTGARLAPDTDANCRLAATGLAETGPRLPCYGSVLISLATGALCGFEAGLHKAKRPVRRPCCDPFWIDSVLGMYCWPTYFCSYFLIALLQALGVDVVFRQHQRG